MSHIDLITKHDMMTPCNCIIPERSESSASQRLWAPIFVPMKLSLQSRGQKGMYKKVPFCLLMKVKFKARAFLWPRKNGRYITIYRLHEGWSPQLITEAIYNLV